MSTSNNIFTHENFQNELVELCKKANISIKFDDKSLIIKHIVNFKNKEFYILILFVIFGLFFLLLPSFNNFDFLNSLISILLALLFLFFSLISIIRQKMDFVQISPNLIKSRYNLKYTEMQVDANSKLVCKNEHFSIKRTNALASYFELFTFHIKQSESDLIVLKFQLENKQAKNSLDICNKLCNFINKYYFKT